MKSGDFFHFFPNKAFVNALAIFCGSRMGTDPAYSAAAKAIALACAEMQCTIVYGGAKVGLMGVVADTCLAAGGTVIGVIPRSLRDREVAHTGLHKLIVVDSMHERKAQMAELADGFLALPGGIGTLDEIFEQMTWRQLRIHHKPCAFLNTLGYYDPLLEMLDRMAARDFLGNAAKQSYIVEREPQMLIERLQAYRQ